MSAAAPSAAATQTGEATALTAAAAADTAAAGSKRSLSSADERRVQPRHARDEPDTSSPTAIATTSTPRSGSSSSVAASSESTHRSPAVRLYRHALESILAFSDGKTLAAGLRVSKEWLAAIRSMRALALKAECRGFPDESVASSPMTRHIRDLVASIPRQRVSGEAVGSVARLMPHLRRLQCAFPLLPADGPLLFPAQLREVELSSFDHTFSVAEINTAIEAISRLEQLESLELTGTGRQTSFAPLTTLPLLRRLSIDAVAETELTDAQIGQLRALPRLRQLDIVPPSTSLLRRLLPQPHNLEWQQIPLPWPLRDAAAMMLPHLPSLTALGFSAEYVSSLDFLQELPNLASLYVTFPAMGADDPQVADRLVDALQHCANIANLRLDRCGGLTAAHLEELLPHLPRLRELELTALDIDSLSFLAQPPMINQLSKLRMDGCTQLSLIQLHHVHTLHGLRQLSLLRSFTVPMDEHSRSLLTPPSAALPQLAMFEYAAAP